MRYAAVLSTSGAASLLSVTLSVILITKHCQTWTRPAQQLQVVKIIALAPLFAIDCFVGVLELDAGETVAHLLDMLKECYEAVAIHAFLMLMYDIVGLTEHLNKKSKKTSVEAETLPDGVKGRALHVPFPLGLLYPHHPPFDVKWLRRLRRWTLQFVILRPLLSVSDLLLVDLFPSEASHTIGLVITIALNLSVTLAFFALITFYHAFEDELGSRRPLAKLLCIKGVVFFATWQGVVLKVLGHYGILHEGHRFSTDEVALAWQDLLVCLEMGLIFSPLHLYAFPPEEFSGSGAAGVKKGAVEKGSELEMKKLK